MLVPLELDLSNKLPSIYNHAEKPQRPWDNPQEGNSLETFSLPMKRHITQSNRALPVATNLPERIDQS